MLYQNKYYNMLFMKLLYYTTIIILNLVKNIPILHGDSNHKENFNYILITVFKTINKKG